MAQMVFFNLPVKDLEKSKAFFSHLGYLFNPQFTDENAACMVISEHIYAMLLTHARFKDFTPREICDATKSTEVLICLSCESRARVDEIVSKAVAAGGAPHMEAKDYGMMYGHGFTDPDGHIWEVMWMDPSAVQ
ncbi:VOC family protein [Singulisphaera sp. PoT]|uniref:VOC family protein n=1 Tax=Singulisphaera sp. PoT TaxID=3411797 RepID=UPI003BF4A4E6